MRRFCRDIRLYVIDSLVFALFCFLSVSLSLAGAPDFSKSQFLTEAPQKEAEYLIFAERLQGSVSLTFTITDSKGITKSRTRSRKEIKQNEQCASLIYQSFDGEKKDIDDKRTFGGVNAVNSIYAFELKRGSSKQDWFLERLHLTGKGKETPFEGTSIRDMLFSWTAPMYDVYGRRISTLIREKTFQVTHGSRINRNDRDLIQIDFICPHPIPDNAVPYFVQGGSLLLDPERFWCIQECDLKTQSIDGEGTMRTRFEFKPGTDRFPIVAHMVRKGKSPLGNVSEEIFEFDFREMSKLPPDRDFTLSAFELPEPMGISTPPQLSIWLWLLAAAVFAAAMAMLFVWLKRRHMKTDTPSSKAKTS